MKFLTSILLFVSCASAYTYERLNKNDTAFVIIDIQVGLFSIARDYDAILYRNAIYAHAELAKVFGIPMVLTTSGDVGPNGPLPADFLEMFPDTPVVKRLGEVNAWDNPEFRKAIEATGKKQVVLAGITTDVCTSFAALSMREAGYSVFVNAEASGTTTELVRSVSNDRMRDAGVQVLSTFAIMSELMRDWRETPGAAELFPFLDKYYPAYTMVARAHRAAVENGTVITGEDKLH
ncbi:Isochorismatase hydrolase [Apiospora hydei]|uniref:Isochorismatase hydrolase n=1 Tax=Apiospora hydei TaxID=1337664 RepID=A0ABR1W9X2_9PEZI